MIDPVGEYGGCVISDPEHLADYINRRGDGEFHVSYRDRGLDGRSMSEKFRMLQSLRNCWIVVEEAWKWVGPTMPDQNVTWFVDYGRHNGISSIWVTQRAAHLHRDITFNADVVISFAQNEPRDLDYLRKVNAEAAERVALLGPHEWEYVKEGGQDIVRELEVLTDGVESEGDMGGSRAVPGDGRGTPGGPVSPARGESGPGVGTDAPSAGSPVEPVAAGGIGEGDGPEDSGARGGNAKDGEPRRRGRRSKALGARRT